MLDFDSDEALKELKLERFIKKTLVVKTGSGKYHIYIWTEKPIRTTKLFRNGRLMLEIRGEGSFTILPNSIHPTGGFYQLLSKPGELITVKDPIAELAKLLGASPAKIEYVNTPMIKAKVSPIPDNYRPPCIKKLLHSKTKICEGWRNEALIRLVSFFHQVYGEDHLLTRALVWNRVHCTPPLDVKEVVSVVKSVTKGGYIYRCRGLSPLCVEKMKCRIYRQFYLNKLTQKIEEMKLCAD